MTLADLIRRVRTDANDMVEPYFWSDQDVADWLNDAVREAAVRGRLIHESQADAVCRIEVVAGTASTSCMRRYTNCRTWASTRPICRARPCRC